MRTSDNPALRFVHLLAGSGSQPKIATRQGEAFTVVAAVAVAKQARG